MFTTDSEPILRMYFATKLAQENLLVLAFTLVFDLRNSNDFAYVTLACAEGF